MKICKKLSDKPKLLSFKRGNLYKYIGGSPSLGGSIYLGTTLWGHNILISLSSGIKWDTREAEFSLRDDTFEDVTDMYCLMENEE